MRSSPRFILGAIMLVTVIATPSAYTQTYEVLYSFAPIAGGAFPSAGLVRDSAGNLYGTTTEGGIGKLCGNPLGCGTVFKISASGVETVLYSFPGGADGSFPSSGVIRDAAGNLYGETSTGGATQRGTIFKIDTTGSETVLYSFMGNSDGEFPRGGLLRDSAGNLYGTTQQGGASNNGTVFKLNTSGVKTILHSFAGQPSDGATPVAGVIRDAAGNLYGTTPYGGTAACAIDSSGCGVVFKLDRAGSETLLYSFTGGPDGGTPYGGLIRDSAGSLYGTTYYGGATDNGTVFEISTSGTETVLHSFTGGAGGSYPDAGLVMDKKGNLYGTTVAGGIGDGGTVFEVSSVGSATVLHSFTGMPDGAAPQAGLTTDSSGNLYGTTYHEGAYNAGIVFEIKH